MILNLEDQVCSIESAKRLEELGVPQDSLFYWTIGDDNFLAQAKVNGLGYSAYTVAELGILLPTKIEVPRQADLTLKLWNSYKSFAVGYSSHMEYLTSMIQEHEAEARAKMLIYLLENELITLPDQKGE